jgi:uncharacterized protein YutE (UPF0331/DUF86 family)
VLRAEVIQRRLEKLRRYSRESFLADPERYRSAERFLQLAIEAVTDMSAHVIAELELGVVNQSRDIPRLFRTQGYIDEDLEERWVRMIGFRNILVHDYLDLDRSIVHQVLQNDLDDLRALGRALARFL